MDLKMKSPKISIDDSQNNDDMFLEGHVDYTSLTESGKKTVKNQHL